MKTIVCQGGMVVRISDKDYDLAIKHTWHSSNGYAQAYVNGRAQFLHRLIGQRMGLNLKHGREVDHMDRDPSNDQRWNLRSATKSQGKLNKRLQVDNKSGFKGVSWDESHRGWTITFRKKALYGYKTADEAARHRDYLCSRSIDREFYAYNFPKELDFSDLRIRLQFHLRKGI